MKTLSEKISDYLYHCKYVKRLASKTLKAYRCDLNQFDEWLNANRKKYNEKSIMEYLSHINLDFSASTTKRKFASIRSFSSFLFSKDRMHDPFNEIELRIKIPRKLPRTIPRTDLALIMENPSIDKKCGNDFFYSRNRAILELLIATGARISELCALNIDDFDPSSKNLFIMGKGAKERVIQIESESVLSALAIYYRIRNEFRIQIRKDSPRKKALFINRFGERLTEQSARNAISDFAQKAGSSTHITPHMFRHTFATMLLERDVDIRYIQAFLGHSSVKTTEIYTHVASSKLREIMRLKNPRDLIFIEDQAGRSE